MNIVTSTPRIPFNLLDIPAELAFIYSKLDGKLGNQ